MANFVNKDTVYFLANDTKLSASASIGPNVVFGCGVVVEDNVIIDGHCHFENTIIKAGAHILPFCHIAEAVVGAGSKVGPFARLRPGTKLDANVKVGSFVEVKKATIGENASVAHLSYIGDAEIGAGVNVGGGTVFANYNSITKVKAKTTVGAGASIGANNSLVAPVTVGANAMTGAGSVITQNVPAGALAVERCEQQTVEGYVARKQKSIK